MSLLEVACFNTHDAIIAFRAGADRIELCDDRQAGGITPPRQWLAEVKKAVTIPVFVMIRARGGNFCYSEPELNRMRSDLDHFKKHADGLVFGILQPDGKVDVAQAADFVRRAHPLPCTFHRAFDETPDLLQALEDVISTGCKAVLTSGGAPTVMTGLTTLAQLVREARSRITIIPGGGVRSRSIVPLRTSTQATVFHSSGIVKGSKEPSPAEIQRMKALLSQEESEALDPQTVVSPDANEEEEERLAMSAVSIGQVSSYDEVSMLC